MYNPTQSLFDMIVIGAGPAGLALASEVAMRLEGEERVLLVTPKWPQPWPNNYGVWRDELEHDDALLACVSHTFPSPQVILPSQRGHARALPRDYVKLDNALLQELLAARFEEASGQVLPARVEDLRHELGQSVLRCVVPGEEEVMSVSARLVVDATGNEPHFVRRPLRSNPGYQVAYGYHARVLDAPPRWLETMRVMDWTPPGGIGTATSDEQARPSFLYAMRVAKDEVFVEETSLVARPAVPMDVLRRRLEKRLEREGVKLSEPLSIERCVIPMGHAIPDLSQRTLATGGAASKVHPASGYHMARMLRDAPLVGARLAALLAARAPTPSCAELSEQAWQVIWPSEAQSRRALYMYGMELLLSMDLDGLDGFYEAFFSWPDRLVRGYWSDTLTHGELIESMIQQLGRIKGKRRLDLLRPALTSTRMRRRLVDGVLRGALRARQAGRASR